MIHVSQLTCVPFFSMALGEDLLWYKESITVLRKFLFFFFLIFFFRKFLSISQFSCSVMSNCLQPHELQHARPPCPSPTPGVHPNPCLLSWWCHPTISSSVSPFSSCPQSLPASGSFPVSQLFTSGGQSTEFQLQHHSKQIKQENRNKR